MKRLLNGSVMLLFLSGLLFASCQNEPAEKKEKEPSGSNQAVDFTLSQAKRNQTISVKCSGSCEEPSKSCGTIVLISSGVITCSCSSPKCQLLVSSVTAGIKEKWILSKPLKVFYAESFENYMKKEYADQKYEFAGYEFVYNGKENVETYFFKIKGEEKSVIIVGDAKRMMGMVGETIAYSCQGTCDCKPVYNMNTQKVSCSCSPCSLKKTVFK